MSSAYVALHQADADAHSTDDNTDPRRSSVDVTNSDPTPGSTADHPEQRQISLTISVGTITGITVALVAFGALLVVGIAAAIFWKKCVSRSRPDTDQNEESDTELSLSASTANGASVDSGIDEVGQETDLHIDEPGGVGVDDNIRNEQLKQNLLQADNHNGDMNEDSDSCE
jgi:flagellar biosynthesis/type III secretory pathway M-ring protein FliF/YscJ